MVLETKMYDFTPESIYEFMDTTFNNPIEKLIGLRKRSADAATNSEELLTILGETEIK